MAKKRRQKKRQSKSYVLKCEAGIFHVTTPDGIYKDVDHIVPDNLNRFYVTKEELEKTHNPADAFVAETLRVLESKKAGLMHYYMTYPLEDEEPPKTAEYLAYLFLPKSDREVLLGDLTEEYPSILEKFGQRRARLYFYKQVVASISPLVRKAVIKWGAFGWVEELIRRISS
jgi:hypothetical protein